MVISKLLEIAQKAVDLSLDRGMDQAQAAATSVDSALTRFANSQIHQNVAAKKGGVAIKVIEGTRIGSLRISTLEEKQIREAVRKATKIAKVTLPNKDFKSLPQPTKWTRTKGAYDKETAQCSPDFRAEIAKAAIERAHSKSKLVEAVAGSISTESYAFAVANSLGVLSWANATEAALKVTVISRTRNSQGYGSADQYSRKIRDIEPEKVGDQAAEKSVNSVNPAKIPAGEYEVVLSPRAVANLLDYLSYIGFSATSYQDGQSFVKYNLNKQVFDGKLDVEDDPRDPRTLLPFPIDGEGVSKRKRQLIKNGKVSKRSICHNSFTAGKEGLKRSTGHALPPALGYYERPLPINVIVTPGDATVDEMIRETMHGIFVTRFHYTNPVEPTKAILTGLTRDGTFLIEKGKVTKPVMNLRYTDSMLSALKVIPMIGKNFEMQEGITAPSMKLAKLRFTGTTHF